MFGLLIPEVNENEKNNMCEKHKILCDHFCTECNVVLCCNCVLKYHKNHVDKTISLEEKKPLLLEENKVNESKIKRKIEELELQLLEKEKELKKIKQQKIEYELKLNQINLYEKSIENTNNFEEIIKIEELKPRLIYEKCLFTLEIIDSLEFIFETENGLIIFYSEKNCTLKDSRFFIVWNKIENIQFLVETDHKFMINSLFKTKDGKIVSSSSDLINIWNYKKNINRNKDFGSFQLLDLIENECSFQMKDSNFNSFIEAKDGNIIGKIKPFQIGILSKKLELLGIINIDFDFLTVFEFSDGLLIFSFEEVKLYENEEYMNFTDNNKVIDVKESTEQGLITLVLTENLEFIINIWDKNANLIHTLLMRDIDNFIELSNGNLAFVQNNVIRIFTKSGDLIKELSGHLEPIECLIKSKENYIITGSRDKTIKIWDQNGTIIQTLTGHEDSISNLFETADGYLISISKDKKGKIWSV